ncbi:MAG: hypothetical protein CM15mP74_05780 [Halieaceae bacterium]|nr:MAG: hypothetical protein CM15mP74_05780 [Halieaceae bacterium]
MQLEGKVAIVTALHADWAGRMPRRWPQKAPP